MSNKWEKNSRAGQ